jgi:hypothetical protein
MCVKPCADISWKYPQDPPAKLGRWLTARNGFELQRKVGAPSERRGKSRSSHIAAITRAVTSHGNKSKEQLTTVVQAAFFFSRRAPLKFSLFFWP